MSFLEAGLWLTLQGMGFVFGFLLLLVIAMVIKSSIILKFFPEKMVEEKEKGAGKGGVAVAIAIAAANRQREK